MTDLSSSEILYVQKFAKQLANNESTPYTGPQVLLYHVRRNNEVIFTMQKPVEDVSAEFECACCTPKLSSVKIAQEPTDNLISAR
jgi:hypothetical protein